MQLHNALPKTAKQTGSNRFVATLASHLDEVRACQRLRHDIFAGEMHATLETPLPDHDVDHFDDFCDHLYVRDLESGLVVATTRILVSETAAKAGSFYAETEFDIRNIISAPGNYMEIGRTCVHPKYRRGIGLNYLWQGVANLMNERHTQFLFGCVSIPWQDDGEYIGKIMRHVRKNHYAPGYLRVTPRTPVTLPATDDGVPVVVPPLLRTYLNLGAVACGEPCLDPLFNVADIFILVDRQKMNPTYDKHFLREK